MNFELFMNSVSSYVISGIIRFFDKLKKLFTILDKLFLNLET